jgi:hypothetical protein
MGSTKTQELRALVGLAIKLRVLAEESDDIADTELFLSAAHALEARAHHLAYGTAPAGPPSCAKIDILC